MSFLRRIIWTPVAAVVMVLVAIVLGLLSRLGDGDSTDMVIALVGFGIVLAIPVDPERGAMTVIPDLPTPEKALKAYRQLVEMNEMAIPVLLVCTVTGELHTISLHTTGHPYQGLLQIKDALIAGKLEKLEWALLSAESTLTTKDRVTDAAVFTLTSHDQGHVFTAVKSFVRVGGVVVWQPTIQVYDDEMDGLVNDLMLSLVR